ncbi:hypothetical protein ADK38_13555 [Streptomyces varsoviensis]|uniref:Amidohydrolase-related domain-containing protein n=1 Tax=Streptomyces varsoviensis TaxID=67373 RepID=A0ABR5J881_9ACTN|nr:hypothetical protein ADK38_13555 [Streptomyces varsoviensis]
MGEQRVNRCLITAERVWDGRAPEPVREGFVRIEGELITAVGRRADLGADAARDTPHIDLPGATLLPGLVNGHVHMALSGSDTPIRDYRREARAGDAALAVRAVRNLRSAVESGVTTVRDLGTVDEVATATGSATRATPPPRSASPSAARSATAPTGSNSCSAAAI